MSQGPGGGGDSQDREDRPAGAGPASSANGPGGATDSQEGSASGQESRSDSRENGAYGQVNGAEGRGSGEADGAQAGPRRPERRLRGRYLRPVPAGARPAEPGQRGGRGAAAGPREHRGARVAQRPGGTGPGTVRRPPVRRRGGQLPADRRRQPGRRLRPVRPGPGPGPDRQPARRGRAPGAGRGHAAGPAALLGRAARRPGDAAGPPRSRPAGPDQPQRAGPGGRFRSGRRPGYRARLRAGVWPGGRVWPGGGAGAAGPGFWPDRDGPGVTGPDQADAPPALLRGCDRPLHEVYDTALLDLDGVIYVGKAAVPGAAEALAKVAAAGMNRAFVTNNASRSPSAIAAQLTRLGVPATAADVVTSGQAAARLLAAGLPPGARVLVVGGNGLRLALRERGLRPVSTAAERPAAVVQGFSPDISYGLLSEGVLAVRAGARYVAANADRTLPTARGEEMGNGSLVQSIAWATGVQPVVAGKPEPPLHAEAVQRTGARRPLVIGDRLDTDIEGGVRGGADTLLVLTGVSRPADVVAAPPSQRPTYLCGRPGRPAGAAARGDRGGRRLAMPRLDGDRARARVRGRRADHPVRPRRPGRRPARGLRRRLAGRPSRRGEPGPGPAGPDLTRPRPAGPGRAEYATGAGGRGGTRPPAPAVQGAPLRATRPAAGTGSSRRSSRPRRSRTAPRTRSRAPGTTDPAWWPRSGCPRWPASTCRCGPASSAAGS